MKLLFITQVVDRNDAVLGFVHGWLEELSRSFDHLHVICLKKGEVALPENVTVYSLGKEKGASRPKYLKRFFSLVFGLHSEYDNVFVHMNSEYVILAGLFWRSWGKKIVLWYNHTYGTWRARLAMWFAHTVCHTSPYAFTAGMKKSIKMPAGIDTRVFKPEPSVARIKNSVLYLGRLAPVKGVHVLLAAAKLLVTRQVDFVLDIYGAALPKDREYEDELRRSAENPMLKNKVNFLGAIPNRQAVDVFRSHELNVNLTPAGNYDKTVLEAMACGGISVVSSEAFADILTPEFRFDENDAETLSRTLEHNFSRTGEERKAIGERFAKYVAETHDLRVLAKKIRGLYEDN